MNRYVPGHGPVGAKLMILGESPSYVEVEHGRPFVGPSGRELDKLLKDAGISRESCWITNVCKHFVPASEGKKIPFPIRAKNAGIDLHEQLQALQNEINSIKPNCILALGGTALWALSGKTKISDYRGSIMVGMGRKFVPTYHPAHLLYTTDNEVKGYWNRQVMVFDFRRAAHESLTESLQLPSRTLSICRNSAQLHDFIQRYRNYTRPAVDIEAGRTCVPICVGVSFIPSEGITVPLWNEDGISNIPDSDLTSCWILLNELLANNDIVGQNFKYDQDKLQRLGFSIRSLASDTMLKAFAINPELPKGLGFNTSIYTREPFYKNEGMYEGKIEDLLIGCARDACVTKEIDLAMDNDLDEIGQREFYDNFLMKLHSLYLEIEQTGFRVDEARRDELIRKYVEWDERLRYEIFSLVGEELNVNSWKQVSDVLFGMYKLPSQKGTGEEELTALLNSPRVKDETHRTVIEKILEHRRVRKTVSTYLMALPDFDGRMRTTYYLCLETGRTSTGQQDPPIRPTIEVHDEHGRKKKKVLGTAFQTMTKHGDIGADIREQFIPDDGEIFVQVDSSQAEARVVALLADDEDTLRLYDDHDIHALTASWFFGGTEDDYSKKKLGYETPIRFAGKTLRHAGNLGAGKRRAATELNTQARKYKIPIKISEAIADRALKIFHQKSPKIQQVFHAGIIEELKKTRTLIAAVPYGFDIKVGGRRTFFERWGDELFRQAFSYIPQRAVSDNTKGAAIRLKKRLPFLKIIMEAHDALLLSVKENILDEIAPIIKEEMERPIRFDTCSLPRHELIIPCDMEVGYNYAKLSKFKGMAAKKYGT